MIIRALVALLLVAACKDKGATPTVVTDAARPSVVAADAKPSQANPTPEARPDASPAAPDASKAEAPPPPPGGKLVGIEACDEYLDKMARCIGKLSPESAEPLKQAMDDSRKAWQETAQTAEGRTALADACKSALDAAKSAAEAMGCPW